MYFVPILHFASFLADVLLIILVISRNPRARLNVACALLVASLAVWSFFYGLLNLAHTANEAMLFMNCAMIGLASFPMIALWFYLVFTHNDRLLKYKAFIVLLTLLPVAFCYQQWTGNMVDQVIKTTWGWAVIWSRSEFSFAYLAYVCIMLVILVSLLIRLERTTQVYREKKQARMQIVFGAVAVLLALTHAILYQMSTPLIVPQTTDILTVIWGIGIVYSISKYGLMSLTPAVAADEILGTMTDSILLLDARGKIVYANQANSSLLGTRRSKLKGADFNLIVSDRKKADELLADTTGRGARAQRELSYISSNGNSTPVLVSASVIREPNSNVTGYVIAAVDISERKRIEEQLIKSNETLKKTLNDAINTMTKIVEMRDPYTFGHQRRVTDLAVAIARKLKIAVDLIDRLRMAATIHDIGKIYVPADILSKPGKLSDIEYRMIQTHSQGGYDIIKSMDFPCSVAESVLQHHERLDGSGYPQGLKEDKILMEAKILAVADTVEAMASHRPYRPALGIDKALEEIWLNKGRLYDTEVADACLQLFNQKDFLFE